MSERHAIAHTLRRRLRIVFTGAQRQPDGPIDTAAAQPDLSLAGYSEDCRFSGRVRLDGERLSDMLNAYDEFQLVDTQVEGLDGRLFEVGELVVTRDELLAVHASGPRGNPGRRTRTHAHAVLIQSGPYVIRGYLHVLPGADPLASARRRRPMVPLTNAWVEYAVGGALCHSELGTIVVNRETADWMRLASDAEVAFPEAWVAEPASVADGRRTVSS
jgi:hypothetical protein